MGRGFILGRDKTTLNQLNPFISCTDLGSNLFSVLDPHSGLGRMNWVVLWVPVVLTRVRLWVATAPRLEGQLRDSISRLFKVPGGLGRVLAAIFITTARLNLVRVGGYVFAPTRHAGVVVGLSLGLWLRGVVFHLSRAPGG